MQPWMPRKIVSLLIFPRGAPAISPINTPEKIHTSTEEFKIMLCTSNKIVASNVMKKFPLSAYDGPTNYKNHFIFSANVSPSQIKLLKKDSLKIIKPPHGVHIVNFQGRRGLLSRGKEALSRMCYLWLIFFI